MADVEKVYDCCSFEWQKPTAIAREYDRRFPPKWYNFVRLALRKMNVLPTVSLYLELTELEIQRRIEFKIEPIITVDSKTGQEHDLKIPYYRKKR